MANWPGIYDTGTASVEQGSMTVTLQSAGPVVNAIRPGDRFGSHVGRPIRIEAVAAGSLTLAFPWPGPSQSATPYEIMLNPYDSGYRQALQELIERYGGGAVAALAELEGDIDKLPFFIGPDAMDLTDLTAKGREIIGAADSAAARQVIGAISAADIPVVDISGKLDVTGGNIGTNAAAFKTNVGIVDDLSAKLNLDGANIGSNAAGFRNNTGTNDASNMTGGTLPNGRVSQTLDPTRAFRRGNILGTVGQSSGEPNGAIIERGSNANGEYVRFADGTLICYAERTAGSSGAATWTFPSNFAHNTYTVSALVNGSASLSAFFPKVVTRGQGAMTFVGVYSPTNTWAPAFSADPYILTAIGRWF